jgi:uncharacterized membrane protein
MRTTQTRPAKRARRKFGPALLGVLCVLGTVGIAVVAMPSAKSFEVSATPAAQTVSQGQTATYAVALQRGQQFTSPVALSVTGLPTGTSAHFAPSTIAGSAKAASLVVETTAGAPVGTHALTIRGAHGGKSASAEVTLRVLAGEQANFSLQATPSARVVTTDDEGSYLIGISRAGAFEGPVALTTSGLPKGVTAAFTPDVVPGAATEATLRLATSDHAKPGTYPITVTGLAQIGSASVTRSTSVNLVVEAKKPFSIYAPSPQVAPGEEAPLDLLLSNPHNFPIHVHELAVALDPHATTSACDVRTNFAVEPAADIFPLTLEAHESARLSDQGVDPEDMPALQMRNLASNQDGCKGAEVYLQYSGRATKR